MARHDRTATARRRTPPPRRRRPAVGTAVAVALVLATVVALVVGTGDDDARSTVAYDRETQVLDFTATTFDGKVVASEQLRGKPVVLNFYASWCTVCDRELPDFERVARQLDGQVAVLGANPQSNDTDDAQAAMIKRSGVTYPTFPDSTDELLRQFNTTGGLPTTVFIDADGVVRIVHNGLLTEALLLEDIASVLGVRA
jgi:thiol-disulfide isomerase/thioredoxin